MILKYDIPFFVLNFWNFFSKQKMKNLTFFTKSPLLKKSEMMDIIFDFRLYSLFFFRKSTLVHILKKI